MQCSVEGCDRQRYGRQPYCEMHYRRVRRTGEPGPPEPIKRTRGTCKVEGCREPHDANGLCHGHYQREQRNGGLDMTPLRKRGRVCSVEGCGRPHKAGGYCAAHYKRVLVHGHPQADTPIRKSDGKGHIHHGYMVVSVPPELRHLSSGKTKLAEHRFVMAMHLDRPLAADENVHHINGIRTDNRLENLELWSTAQPSGQRVLDLIEFAHVIMDRYWEESSQLDPR
jgi:hypothetical protein